MLAVTTYSPDHIDRCRAWVDANLAAWGRANGARDAATELEPAFANAMVLALDHWFLHRMRSREGKDGNALNEVRVLCDSITDHDGVLNVDSGIRLTPETSVLGFAAGDQVRLTASDFRRLADAFLAEIASRY